MAGQFKTAIPAIPINKEIINCKDGLFLSNRDSIMATQIGVQETIKAVYPESTFVSTRATKPFPIHQRARPEIANTIVSFRVR